MSRRNTRQGKARRRADRDRRQCSGTSDQGPRAVEVLAVQAAPRPDGPGHRNSDEHGSGLRSDAGGGLIAVELGEADLDSDADLENADPGDFGDLDADDAGLQAALTVLAVLADDISDVAEVADDLAGDVDGPEVRDGPEDLEDPETGQPSAEADGEAEGPGAAGMCAVTLSPAAGEDEEIFVFGDDDDDLPPPRCPRRRDGGPGQGLPEADRQGAAAQRRARGRAGQAHRGGPVRRGEAHRGRRAFPATSGSTWSGSPRTGPGPRITCSRPTCGSWCRWPSGTPDAACCSWT